MCADGAKVARCCLGLCCVPSDSKPHVVVSALENAALPDDRVGVHWAVVDNASPALHGALCGRFHLFGASRWTRAISR